MLYKVQTKQNAAKQISLDLSKPQSPGLLQQRACRVRRDRPCPAWNVHTASKASSGRCGSRAAALVDEEQRGDNLLQLTTVSPAQPVSRRRRALLRSQSDVEVEGPACGHDCGRVGCQVHHDKPVHAHRVQAGRSTDHRHVGSRAHVARCRCSAMHVGGIALQRSRQDCRQTKPRVANCHSVRVCAHVHVHVHVVVVVVVVLLLTLGRRRRAPGPSC